MNTKSILFIVLVIILTALATQNTHTVNLNILFWKIDLPVILMIFLNIGLGFVVGYFAKNIFKIFGTDKKTDIEDK